MIKKTHPLLHRIGSKKFYLLVTILLVSIRLNGQLTINITSIPTSTPPKAEIFIAGNFNSWNPGNAAYKMTDNGNETYSITFSPSPGVLEYKFTRGSWETVEGSASGDYIPNRTYNYSSGIKSIDVTIAGWEEKGGNHTAAGNVHIVNETFYMPQLGRARRIWIYLPPDYESTSKQYPVVYMHDGQNLFDAFYSFAGEWKIDESINELFDNNDYGAIVVGIDNGGNQRINEYSPWIKPGYGGGDGELYAEFIVNTLKPFIDSNYRTYTGREYTAIAGSSMGANISMYTGIEYQEVFSKVGIFSPAFWFTDSIYLHVSEEGLHHEMRFYFVAGDNESADMIEDMMSMVDILVAEGAASDDLRLLHHADGAHSEWYWAREYPAAYEWLFNGLILNNHPLRIVKDFIFPNSADNYLRIQSEVMNVPYTIYSPLGKVIRSSKSVRDSINISGLPPGFYFLEIRSDRNEYYLTRFIKQ